eukprot:scpid67399/ scgid6335/ 
MADRTYARRRMRKRDQVKGCACNKHGTCTKCSCVSLGRSCQGRVLSANGRCSNQQSRTESSSQAVSSSLTTTLSNEGGPNSDIRSLWWKTGALRGEQYEIPDGNVGLRFCNILADEIERSNSKRQSSEREFIFAALVLQRNTMIRKEKDIHRLLTRRMDMWEAGQLSELLREAEHCDQQLISVSSPMATTKVERTFAHLMLQGRVRSAVRLLTERNGGGVLDPADEAHGKTGPALGEVGV